MSQRSGGTRQILVCLSSPLSQKARGSRACRIDFAITRRPRIGIRLLPLRASRIDPKTERTLHHNLCCRQPVHAVDADSITSGATMLRTAGRVLTRRVAPATGATLVVGSAAFYASDPKTASRTYVLLTEMAPVILAYRFVEKKQQIRKYLNHENPQLEDAEWDSLHNKYAKPTVDCMRRMLGSYVKLGQFLALRPDIVPQVWTDELRTLESAVPAQSTKLVHETIQRAYGKNVSDVFESFDDEPVGSASIGQVHRATLKDGSRVAVKVQYGAGNETVMRNDIRHGKELFRILAPEQVAVLDEIEAQFATEFDYRQEARIPAF